MTLLPVLATAWLPRLQSLLGIALLLGLAWSMSTDRRRVPWRVIGWGMGLQFVFAIVVLRTAPGRWAFDRLNDAVLALMGCATAGARFLFGSLVDGRTPVVASPPGGGPTVPMTLGDNVVAQGLDGMLPVADVGAFMAFNVLPTIIFFSSLMAVLYHLGAMQWLVRGMGWLMARTLGTSGAESMSAAANIFVGQTEAPLVVAPYVSSMTRSELHAIMVGGFATVAGGVMAAYVGMLRPVFPDIAGHLIAASVMSAPAALVVAKILVPEDGVPQTAGGAELPRAALDANVVDAAARGAGEGLKLALNVGAMLLAFVALVALADTLLGAAGGAVGMSEPPTLQGILGVLFWPLAWMMGVPASECAAVGRLLGIKTVLNEFVAYLQLAPLAPTLSERTTIIASYALCGFANIGSVGIQLGGIGGLAPDRREDLARLGVRAMVGGSLAAFLTANVAGVLVG